MTVYEVQLWVKPYTQCEAGYWSPVYFDVGKNQTEEESRARSEYERRKDSGQNVQLMEIARRLLAPVPA